MIRPGIMAFQLLQTKLIPSQNFADNVYPYIIGLCGSKVHEASTLTTEMIVKNTTKTIIDLVEGSCEKAEMLFYCAGHVDKDRTSAVTG